MCSRPAFILSFGMVQQRASRSISSQTAFRTSPDLAAVRTMKANASFTTSPEVLRDTARSSAPICAISGASGEGVGGARWWRLKKGQRPQFAGWLLHECSREGTAAMADTGANGPQVRCDTGEIHPPRCEKKNSEFVVNRRRSRQEFLPFKPQLPSSATDPHALGVESPSFAANPP